MTFDDVYADVAIGVVVVVSNGRSEPPVGTLRWRAWRASNFSGAVRSKQAGPPRRLVIQSDADSGPGRVISFEIDDGLGHTFELAE